MRRPFPGGECFWSHCLSSGPHRIPRNDRGRAYRVVSLTNTKVVFVVQQQSLGCGMVPSHMPHRTSLLMLLLVVCAAPSFAVISEPTWTAEQRTRIDALERAVVRRDGMWCVDTPSFRCRSEIDARFTAELACYLDLVQVRAIALLSLGPAPDPSPCQVTVYADRQRYQRAVGRRVQSRGQFDWDFSAPPAERFSVSTFVVRPEERSFARFYRPILNHEVGHWLLQSRAGARRIPNLVNEGVATFLQSWDMFAVEPGRTAKRREFARELERAVRAKALPSIAQLAVADPWDVDGFGSATAIRYACAESFIGFLAESTEEAHGFLATLVSAAISGGDVLPLVSGNGSGWETRWRDQLTQAYAPAVSGAAAGQGPTIVSSGD